MRDILNEYVGSDGCFKVLDDVLRELNADNYNVVSSANELDNPKNFTSKFNRAMKTLRDEHLSKLPSNEPICHEVISKLLLRLAKRFDLRAACVRPISDKGRLCLMRDISSVYDSLITTLSLHGGSVGEESLKSELKGMEALISNSEKISSLVERRLVRKTVAWHHIFASLPSDVHSPHNKTSMILVQYLNEIEMRRFGSTFRLAFKVLHFSKPIQRI